jgi:hypothetical protein
MRITALSRDEGQIGDEVVITGSGLGNAQVHFNGVRADCLEQEDGKIVTHVPAGAVTGPLSVAGGGKAAETQFTVDVIPHGKEKTYQGIETLHQRVYRAAPGDALPEMTSANPEAADNKLPGVPVTGEGSGSVDEGERKLEHDTRVVQPPSHGQPVVTPAVPPGTVVAPVVVSGPTGVPVTLPEPGTPQGKAIHAIPGHSQPGPFGTGQAEKMNPVLNPGDGKK